MMKRCYLRIAAACVLAGSLGGCRLGGENGAYRPETPVTELLSTGLVSERELEFEFSAPVRVLSLTFVPVLEVASLTYGRTVRVALAYGLEPGAKVSAEILAEDGLGNTLAESAVFRRAAVPPDYGSGPDDGNGEEDDSEPDYGDEPGNGNKPDYGNTPEIGARPLLAINELRILSRTGASLPAASHRAEFVEFRMLGDGNLYGLRVFIYRSGTAEPTVFEFPEREVRSGEYAVLHLRTLAYRYSDSDPSAHNFWIPGAASHINRTAAIYVLDGAGRVLCAVMISESADPQWWQARAREHFPGIAAFLFEQGAWMSGEGRPGTPEDAVNASTAATGTGTTNSISRDETAPGTGTAADWYVTATGGATPGRPNLPR